MELSQALRCQHRRISLGGLSVEERITIHEKARGESINVYIGEYKGTKYLHIREWYVDKDSEEKPTKKGVALPFDKIEALKEAIERLVPKAT